MSQAVRFRYLSQEEVVAMGGLDMALAVADIEEVFRLHTARECVLPSKVVLRWGDVDSEMVRGRINGMPGYVGGRFDMAGIKWIASMPANVRSGMPRASGLTILNHPTLGYPLAVMDGTVISAMRTGAVGGVACKYLARQDARSVGIIGAGVQSRTQLMALKVARPGLTTVRVFDILPERTSAWCEDMRRRMPDVEFVPVASGQEAARAADILVSATTTNVPVVQPGWMAPGSLYCQVGSNEVHPDAVSEFDRIVVDNWGEVEHRGVAQGLIAVVQRAAASGRSLLTELGEIVTGAKPGRTDDRQRIMFNSVGMGIEDVAIATRVFRRAEQEGVGTMLTFWESPEFV